MWIQPARGDPLERPPVLAENASAFVRLEDYDQPAFLCDAESTILEANATAGQLGAWAARGGRLFNVAAKSDEAHRLQADWLAASRRPNGWSTSWDCLGDDGAIRSLHLTAVQAKAAPAAGKTWLVLVRDRTHEALHNKQLEVYAGELRQLFEANKEQVRRLEEAEQSRDRFFGLVSHELKTPLTSLIAGLELLASPEVSPAKSAAFENLLATMRRSTDRLEKMIGDLLDLATSKQGALALRFQAVDVTKVIQAVSEEMLPLLYPKRLTIDGPVLEGTPPMVKGDPLRLQQIAQNLLSSAIKASPPGKPIRVLVSSSALVAHVMVVNSTALPVDDKKIAWMFQPFNKSAEGGYRAGAGLGLSVVDALVKSHGGMLSAKAREHEVSFSFTIPLWGGE